MTLPYHVLLGDCLGSLRAMPDCSVHTCVTSPPYFGLRDYGHDGQIGLEDTPEAYVARLVEVFREVRRVLRDDGTLWLNLGDSYGGPAGNNQSGMSKIGGGQKTRNGAIFSGRKAAEGTRAKDLLGIPWRVAFALQADGWYLRQDIIWHKPNPMPESVTDRCTKAHEYLFLLSKSERYYFDQGAVKEPLARPEESLRNTPAVFGGRNKFTEAKKQSRLHSGNEYFGTNDGKRNRRSVWTVTTKPFKGAHFATFPPDLIEPCVLAGAPIGGTVLDPFGGSGTTAGVAVKHGRSAILCELNPAYVSLIHDRVSSIAGSLFAGAAE